MSGTLSVSLSHRFPGGRTLDLAFTAPIPGVIGLFGPSGAGKSSLLAALSGLFRPDRSAIELGGRTLSGPGLWLPPERRRIGVVFQEGLLFPHLSVDANLRYGLRRASPGRSGPGFDEVVSLLGLDALLRRPVPGLSGGERQRVAIGRALLSRPDLLAMDEPLSGLDAARKDEILPYLARLRGQAGLPILYVTHSRREAGLLCDTLVLVRDGRIAGSGPVAEMLAGGELGERADAVALLDGVVSAHAPERGLSRVEAGGFALVLPLLADPVGARIRVAVPARDVVVLRADGAPPVSSAQTVLPARVRAVRRAGPSVSVAVLEPAEGGGQAILARMTDDSVARLGLRPGVAVVALVKSVALAGEQADD